MINKNFELLLKAFPSNAIFQLDVLNDNKIFFEDFYKRNQENLDNETYYKISPSHLFLIEEDSLNAFAYNKDDHFGIVMYSGLFSTLGQLCEVFSSIVHSNEKFDYLLSLEKKMEYPLKDFSFHILLHFVFQHEKAHLCQFSRKQNTANSISEKYAYDGQNQYSLQKIMYEFDADSMAALLFGREIGIWWQKYKIPLQKDDLRCLIQVAMAMLTCFFMELQGTFTPIYYNKGDHPHPWIRTIYSLVNVLDGVGRVIGDPYATNYEPSVEEIFGLTETIMSKRNENLYKEFLPEIVRETGNISHHLKNHLIANIKNFPELLSIG